MYLLTWFSTSQQVRLQVACMLEFNIETAIDGMTDSSLFAEVKVQCYCIGLLS